jgi:hypothetical protein
MDGFYDLTQLVELTNRPDPDAMILKLRLDNPMEYTNKAPATLISYTHHCRSAARRLVNSLQVSIFDPAANELLQLIECVEQGPHPQRSILHQGTTQRVAIRPLDFEITDADQMIVNWAARWLGSYSHGIIFRRPDGGMAKCLGPTPRGAVVACCLHCDYEKLIVAILVMNKVLEIGMDGIAVLPPREETH